MEKRKGTKTHKVMPGFRFPVCGSQVKDPILVSDWLAVTCKKCLQKYAEASEKYGVWK